MSARRSFRRRVRYKFDTILARGTGAVILWLGLITGTVVLVTGTLLSVLEIAVHGHEVYPSDVPSLGYTGSVPEIAPSGAQPATTSA